MTLDILIPHYKEPENLIKRLLDSIALQQGIDFNNIKVIIINDGDDVILSNSFLSQYSFNLQYEIKAHEGVSAARNTALELSQADFVIFCDADDMFSDSTAFWQIFYNIQEDADVFKSIFFAEFPLAAFRDGTAPLDNIDQTYLKIVENKNIDSIFYAIAPQSLQVFGQADTFIHGKIFRRKFLLENNLKWPIGLGYAEDSYYCKLALSLSKKTLYYDKPFYIWCNNKNSVTRLNFDGKFNVKRLEDMLTSTTLLIKGMVDHGQIYEAQTSAVSNIYYTTFFFLCDSQLQNEEIFKPSFEAFLKLFKYLKTLNINNFTNDIKQYIFDGVKQEIIQEYPNAVDITLEEVETWVTKYLKEPE